MSPTARRYTRAVGTRPGGTILIVESDDATALLLRSLLERNGYRTLTAHTGVEAILLLRDPLAQPPDLILLELVLPDVDGLLLLDQIRSLCAAPIVVCTSTLRKRDALLALRLGADDVVAKPFDPQEFEARLAAALRRAAGRAAPPRPDEAQAPRALCTVGSLVIDETKRQARLAGRLMHLTPIEYRLLLGLSTRPEHVLTRRDLARLGWGDDARAATVGRAIDVHIRRLRAKLEAGGGAGPGRPDIVTIRAVGYKLVCRDYALSA